MSRYDLFRRRIAPVALFLAIGLLARDSCERDQRIHTTVELSFGDAAPRVRGVEVNVMAGDETVAISRRYAPPDGTIGPVRFPLALANESGELRIDVDLGGSHQQVVRRFHAVEGATLRVEALDPQR